jgi:hypothetical protein
VKTVEIDVEQLHANPVHRALRLINCGFTWLPRIEGRQAKCPNCQSRKWDVKKNGKHR